MSILKKKIARAKEIKKQTKQQRKSFKITPFQPPSKSIQLRPRDSSQREVLKAQLGKNTSKNGLTSSKNIMKNYSTAIIRFALSDLAKSFLQPLLEKYALRLEDFQEFINSRKPQANCIKGLRRMLLAEEEDCKQTIRMKEVFKDISIIFIKRFSVNWIYSSKITDKRTHLDCRFKILRRLNNPLHFTYLVYFSEGIKKTKISS